MRAAQFYKADLQMQTPVDRLHWRGPERLLPTSDDEERQQIANDYINRCYEVGLEVLGVTDHNIAPADCPSLLPELEKAAANLASSYGYKLTIFPGFEVAVTIGQGTHVLCLFEPGTSVQVLSEKLTELGLPATSRFTEGRPNPTPVASGLTLDRLIRIVQEDAHTPGMIILAHAVSSSGVMDSDNIAQWWSADVLKDDRLLCMELPHSRNHYLELPSQTLSKSILENRDSRYTRRHPIASICSSDCKSLEPLDDNRNYIGFRSTWIKMGDKTIEGLRQAFLDHDSRVRFDFERPELAFRYPQIRSLEVSDTAFLSDQQLVFSPNLNVIIGGSGSGKSTLFNYLRMCMGQDVDIRGDDVRANYEKNLETIKDNTSLTVKAELEGQSLSIEYSGESARINNADKLELINQNISAVLPVRFYGQREIYNIAEDRAAIVSLVDDLHRDELSRIQRRAAELARKHDADAAIARDRDTLVDELREVHGQRARAQTAVTRLSESAAPLAALGHAEQRLTMATRLSSVPTPMLSDITEMVNELSHLADSVSVSNDERLLELKEESRRASNKLAATIRSAVSEYERELRQIADSRDVSIIKEEQVEASRMASSITDRLQDQGIDVESFSKYSEELEGLDAEIGSLEERIDRATAAEDRRAAVVAELRDLWVEETDLRKSSADRLNNAVPLTATNQPFLCVSVHAHGDDAAFERMMGQYRGDRRRISDDDWSELLRSVLAHSNGGSPTHLLLNWLAGLDRNEDPEGFPWTDERRKERIAACFTEEIRHALATARIPDRVSIELRRHDGSSAGNIEQGLSVGQRCTAVLALLLALDTSPVVIDQPEDEIDNEFTYREMVPLLRKVKEQRQIIVVTHDPNIPVNGDAEMIHALAAVGGEGQIKTVDGVQAVGSLDQGHVRLAVEEIMEGSEEAFRRRFVKYGF